MRRNGEDAGPTDLRGEEFKEVLMGDRACGGGRIALPFRRVDKTSVGSGIVPVANVISRDWQIRHETVILSPISILSSPTVELWLIPLRLGDFSGESNIPSRGSRPCSSRIPVSLSVTPVFLDVMNIKSSFKKFISHSSNLPSGNSNIGVISFALVALRSFSGRHVLLVNYFQD